MYRGQGYAQNEEQSKGVFDNPFHMEDLLVFDDETLHWILEEESFGLTMAVLARSIQHAPRTLVQRIGGALSPNQGTLFRQEFRRPVLQREIEQARKQVLDALFWELTYWKTPELYEELTEGELLHPGIFQQLEADMRGKTVADVGAGSGRATFECFRHGAALVYAVEPSPGLRGILAHKRALCADANRLILCGGRFDALPLQENSVDMALSCSAFTADPQQGGEPGLAELRRVTKPQGKIVVIWPRAEDQPWFAAHGFQYSALPTDQPMRVHFRSLSVALNCAHRFYGYNRAVARYLRSTHCAEVPFSVIGVNPPHDYCWLELKKGS